MFVSRLNSFLSNVTTRLYKEDYIVNTKKIICRLSSVFLLAPSLALLHPTNIKLIAKIKDNAILLFLN